MSKSGDPRPPAADSREGFERIKDDLHTLQYLGLDERLPVDRHPDNSSDMADKPIRSIVDPTGVRGHLTITSAASSNPNAGLCVVHFHDDETGDLASGYPQPLFPPMTEEKATEAADRWLRDGGWKRYEPDVSKEAAQGINRG